MAEQIISVIDELCKKLGIAIDWSSENITPILMDLINKYTKYIIINNVFWLCFSVTTLFAGICWSIIVYKDFSKEKPVFFTYDRWNGTKMRVYPIAVSVVLGVISIIDCIVIPCCIYSLIKAYSLGEYYAVEKIIESIKNSMM